jgi:hypothetical protein
MIMKLCSRIHCDRASRYAVWFTRKDHAARTLAAGDLTTEEATDMTTALKRFPHIAAVEITVWER